MIAKLLKQLHKLAQAVKDGRKLMGDEEAVVATDANGAGENGNETSGCAALGDMEGIDSMEERCP